MIAALVFEQLGAANRAIDVVVLVLLATFLVSRKPAVLVVVVVLYVTPFLLTLERVAAWAEKRESKPLEIPVEAASATPTAEKPTSIQPREQIAQAAQVIGEVAGALDGGGTTAAAKSMSTTPPVQTDPGKRLLPSRTDQLIIEALWFWARLTFLFATISLIFVDTTLLLFGLGLMIIPLPYFVLLARILLPIAFGPEANQTLDLIAKKPVQGLAVLMNGTGGSIIMVVAGLAAGLVVFWWYRHQQAGFVEFIMPDPAKQWVRLQGKEHSFEIRGEILFVAGLRLELKRAEPDAANPWHWRFSTGTEVEFVDKKPVQNNS